MYGSESHGARVAAAEPVAAEAPAPAGPTSSAISAVTLDADGDRKLITSKGIRPLAVEQYRRLAAVLHQLQAEQGMKSVMIASVAAGEGKTLTATNLALTLSESFKRRVVLVDADLRRPTLHELLGLPNASGLNDGLKADRDAKLSLFEVTPRLTVLPAGAPNPDPMGGLTSDRMRFIVEEAADKFDWVVIDTPPLGLLSDASLLAKMVDAVVLVIWAGSTPYRMIQRAIQSIGRERIVGVVLNRVVDQPKSYGYYGYGYYAHESSRA
jgi:capsular exopolysaccharide synthesis family protein